MELFSNVSPGVAIVGGIVTGFVVLFIYNKVMGEWFCMKTRKCKKCNGTGFIFEKICSLYELFGKKPCIKCFGKGVK